MTVIQYIDTVEHMLERYGYAEEPMHNVIVFIPHVSGTDFRGVISPIIPPPPT